MYKLNDIKVGDLATALRHCAKTKLISITKKDDAKAHERLIELGYTLEADEVEPGQTPEQQQQALEFAVQVHLNTVAHGQRNYDSIDSAAKYMGGPNALWSAEATILRDWAVAVWEYCYAVIADVTSGERSIPTAKELIAELPVIVWPE